MSSRTKRSSQRRVRHRIIWREHRERKCCANGLLKPARITQRAHQALVSHGVLRVGGKRGAKGCGRLRRTACCEQIEAALRERIAGEIGENHVCFQHNGWIHESGLGFGAARLFTRKTKNGRGAWLTRRSLFPVDCDGEVQFGRHREEPYRISGF